MCKLEAVDCILPLSKFESRDKDNNICKSMIRAANSMQLFYVLRSMTTVAQEPNFMKQTSGKEAMVISGGRRPQEKIVLITSHHIPFSS